MKEDPGDYNLIRAKDNHDNKKHHQKLTHLEYIQRACEGRAHGPEYPSGPEVQGEYVGGCVGP